MRRIDWNVTARTGEPHVRLHVAERAVETWLVLDTSASMTFGTADRRKWDVAEGVALAVGHFAARRGNRLARVDLRRPRADHVARPRQGTSGVLPLLLALRREPDLEPVGSTSLGSALGRIGRLARRRSIVVVVSDFRGPRDWRPALLRLAARHDVLAVEIRDPREQELPDLGDLWLVDPETGPAAPGRHAQPEAAPALRRGSPPPIATRSRASCARSASAHLVLSTAGDWLKPLVGFLATKGGGDELRLADCAPRASPLVALALLAYLLVQRRRKKYVVRFTNLSLLENVVADVAALAAARAARAHAARAHGARRRRRAPRGRDRRAPARRRP